MKYTAELFKATDHCQHRTFITNKYSGARIAVDCGQCDYCIWKRAQKASMRVKTAGSKFEYSFFATLTYNQENLPLLKCDVLDSQYEDVLNIDNTKVMGYEKHDYIPVSDYQETNSDMLRHIFFRQVQGTVPFDREVKQYVPISDNWFVSINAMRSFIRKSECITSPYPLAEQYGHNLIPFLNYVDVQNYIKRIRKHISRYTNDKIHFYAVGEYGPVHFRPHFHLLLFTNSEAVSQVIRECHYKSWKLGGSDFQRAASGASSYVASYVNSLVSAPLLYRSCKVFRPKSRASVGFFETIDSECEDLDDDTQVRKKISAVLDGSIYNFGGISVRSTCPIAYVRTLLPRFSSARADDGYAIARILCAVATTPQRIARYGIIDYDCSSVLSLVRAYHEYLTRCKILTDADKIILHQTRTDGGQCLYSPVDEDSSIDKLYRLFLYCSKFFRNWNLPEFGSSLALYQYRIYRIIKIGIEEEQKRDLENLNDNLKVQSDFPQVSQGMFEVPQCCEIDYKYNDVDIDLMRQLSSRARAYCNDMVKHKKQNDVNNVLNNML